MLLKWVKDKFKANDFQKSIDTNNKTAEEVKDLVKELTATIDGDPDWFRRNLLEREQDGSCGDCVLGDSSQHGG